MGWFSNWLTLQLADWLTDWLTYSLTDSLSHIVQSIGGMEEELVEVRDNIVLPMQMWKLFKGEMVKSFVVDCDRKAETNFFSFSGWIS